MNLCRILSRGLCRISPFLVGDDVRSLGSRPHASKRARILEQLLRIRNWVFSLLSNFGFVSDFGFRISDFNRLVRLLVHCALLLSFLPCSLSANDWHPGKPLLSTRWSAQVSPTNAQPDYPRPQLVRPDWLSLNGLWNYAISPDSTDRMPPSQGKILVPFPVESSLSGVMTNLDEHSKLWYRRTISVPQSWRGRRVRLHFGAVDWLCQVWLNGHQLGRHQGGYDPFTFDITDALRWNNADQLTLRVVVPTEADQPRGKQSRKPEGIFYTSTSGIWQSVWLEPVPEVCIDRLRAVPDVDSKSLRLRAGVNTLNEHLHIEAVATVDGKEVA